MIQDLLKKGAQVAAYDPMAGPAMQKVFPSLEYAQSAADALRGAEGCLVMTEWPEFSRLDKEFDLMVQPVIIEGRRILSRKGVEGICW